MTIKLNESEKPHTKLNWLLTNLFLKNPALMFKENGRAYEGDDWVASKFVVYLNLDAVGKIGFYDNKFFIQSKLIERSRKPRDEFRTVNEKAALRKALDVFTPAAAANVADEIVANTRNMMDNVRYYAGRKVPEFNQFEMATFLWDYKSYDTKIPIPSRLDAKLTDAALQSISDLLIVDEIRAALTRSEGYALREEINDSITVVKISDKSILYRGSSTYDLPEWMQSKVTILKLLENNQAAKNIGCKSTSGGDVYYYIIDGEIPDLIE
jgi:hypothetical protein